MQESKVTSKGQTTLPRDVWAALKINEGDTIRYVVSGSEGWIVNVRSVTELSGMLKRPNQAPVSVEEMDEAIAECATS